MTAPAPPSYDAAVNEEKYPGGPTPYPQTTTPYSPTTPYQYPPQTYTTQPYVYDQPGQAVPYSSTPLTGYHSDHSSDIERGGKSSEDLLGIVSFNQQSVRLGFIRKVYAVLGLQMAVTIAMTCWFLFHEPTKLFVQRTVGVYIAAYILFLVLYIVLACCTNVARKHPINLVLLAFFTLTLAYLVAAISSFHDTKVVLALFGMTLLISTSIIIFASQTKYDITSCGGALFICAFALIFFGLFAGICVPYGYMQPLNVVYSGLGALLFMAFLAFDTQLIMGGKKYELSPEDYVFAAMMLYVDIIYIFLFLLALFGGKN